MNFKQSFLTALLSAALLFPLGAKAAVIKSAEGIATVIYQQDQSEAVSNIDSYLEPGTIITTGDDGKVAINVAPGISFTMQPNTQVTIERTIEDGAVDSLGNAMPEHYITLTVGTIILNTTAAGLGIFDDAPTADGSTVRGAPLTSGYVKGASLGYSKGGKEADPTGSGIIIKTPRGNVTPVLPGESIITVTGDDPNTATVTINAETGSMMAINTEGKQIPVGEGLVAILRPDLVFTPPPGNIPTINQPTIRPTPTPTPSSTPVPTPKPAPVSP